MTERGGRAAICDVIRSVRASNAAAAAATSLADPPLNHRHQLSDQRLTAAEPNIIEHYEEPLAH